MDNSNTKNNESISKGINTAVQETQQELARVLNASCLPPSVMLLILQGMEAQVAALCAQAVAAEKTPEKTPQRGADEK